MQHRHQDAVSTFKIYGKKIDKDRNCRSDRQRGQDDWPSPAPLPMDGRVKYLGQRRCRNPRRAESGERVQVGVGRGMMVDHPLPDLDLPEAVGILQQAVARKQEEEIGSRANAKRQQSPRRALRVNSIGDGEGHELLCLIAHARIYPIEFAPSEHGDHNFE